MNKSCLRFVLLLIMLFMISANVNALCADVIGDEATEAGRHPVLHDNTIDLDIPAERTRSKTRALPVASSAQQVVKRVLAKATALVVTKNTIEPHHQAMSIITSFLDVPFPPPRLFTRAEIV
ncbi:MAG: hypothetical protein ACXWIP_26640 [Burkholderiales bacterium]